MSRKRGVDQEAHRVSALTGTVGLSFPGSTDQSDKKLVGESRMEDMSLGREGERFNTDLRGSSFAHRAVSLWSEPAEAGTGTMFKWSSG